MNGNSSDGIAEQYALVRTGNTAQTSPRLRKPPRHHPSQFLDLDDENCWLRFSNEGAKAYAAFAIFRDMEPEVRSVAKVAQQLGKHENLLYRWHGVWAWRDRALAYDRHRERVRLELLEKKRVKEHEDMNARHIHASFVMQMKATQGLALLKPGDMRPGDIARLAVVGVNIERTARGVLAELTQTTVDEQEDHRQGSAVGRDWIDLDRVTDEELQELYRLTEKATVDPAESGADQGTIYPRNGATWKRGDPRG